MAIKTSTDLLVHFAHRDSRADVDYALRRHNATGHMVPSATAGTATSHCVLSPKKACIIKSVTLRPHGALTAHDTDYATVTLYKEDTASGGVSVAGVGGTSIATAFTTKKATAGSGNWVVGIPIGGANAAVTFAGIDDTDVLTAGQGLYIVLTKANAGVAVPACMVDIDYEYQ